MGDGVLSSCEGGFEIVGGRTGARGEGIEDDESEVM